MQPRPEPAASSPRAFFVLVLGLSVPFWLAGWLTDLEFLPGLPPSSSR